MDEIADVVDRFGITEVYVMPEGRDPADVLAGMRDLAPAVLARKWNLTTRLHILLWNDQRAV